MKAQLRKPLLLIAPVWSFCLVLGAAVSCMSPDKERKDPGYKLTAEEQKVLDEYKAEVEIGRNMAGRLLAYYGTNGDQSLIGYVNQVGNYVASYGDYPDRRYMFAILKSNQVNAFACPGGYILVTEGAIKGARTEAELAAILGHEVAHVGKKHMFETLKSMKEKELEENAKAAKERGMDVPAVTMRQRPESEETGAGAMLARYLSGSAGAGLNFLKAASAGMNLITEKGLDRELEFEADQEGVKYAIRAGYDPKAMLRFLTRVKKHAGGKLKELEKTHPTTAQRKKAIKKLLVQLKAGEIIGADGKERFRKMRRRLVSH